MRIGTRLRNWIVAGMLAGAIATLAPAAVLPAAENEGSTAAAPSTASKLNTGDNAWMLTSSALVLLMTAPGLALFYSGLVRKKNVLGVMMQCVFLMCLMTVIWALWGYTLSFGGDAPGPPPKWIGNSDHLLMKGVEAVWVDGKAAIPESGKGDSPIFAETKIVTVPGKSVIPVHPALTINRLTHMLFQGMFFIITPE